MPELTTTAGVLSARALNRATLARQALLRRSDAGPLAMIEHLGGLQAQAPFPPYFGLISRLAEFAPADLAGLLEQRKVVRLALHRGTVHLVTAADALALRPLLAPVLRRGLRANATYRTALEGLDLDALAADSRRLLGQRPMTLADLGPLLAADRPGRDPQALAQAARALLPLVQLPPRAVWGRSGPAVCTTAEHWLDTTMDTAPDRAMDPVTLVRRYLAAFGPATVRDAQAWSGLTGLKAAFEQLRGELVTFTSEQGAELFDLPDAPRPPARAAAPPRLLADFDNLLLGHADRGRFFTEEIRRRVFTVNGIVAATVLLNGRVAGTWTLRAGTLAITLFDPVPAATEAALRREARRTVRIAAPDAEADVRITVGGRPPG